MITRRRWLAGWGLLACTYLALAMVGVVGGRGLESAIPHLVTAAVTFGFAAAVLPVVVPRHADGDDHSGEGGPGGSDPPPPPWWPDFERQFWGHLGTQRGQPDSSRRRERIPA